RTHADGVRDEPAPAGRSPRRAPGDRLHGLPVPGGGPLLRPPGTRGLNRGRGATRTTGRPGPRGRHDPGGGRIVERPADCPVRQRPASPEEDDPCPHVSRPPSTSTARSTRSSPTWRTGNTTPS